MLCFKKLKQEAGELKSQAWRSNFSKTRNHCKKLFFSERKQDKLPDRLHHKRRVHYFCVAVMSFVFVENHKSYRVEEDGMKSKNRFL